MKYLIVTYYKKPNGQIDEAVTVSKKIKPADQQTSNVIMDFEQKQVLKCMIEGNKIDTDWEKLYEYYNRHYPNVIKKLEEESSVGK